MTSLAGSFRRRRPGWAFYAHAFALLVALALCVFLVRMPFQVTDNLAHFLIVDERSVLDIIDSEISEGSKYFRPLLWLTIDAVYELGGTNLFRAFKAVHAAQLLLLTYLFVRLLRVGSSRDLAFAVVAVLALFGLHTFADNLLEAYPINTYMSLLIALLLAVSLAVGAPALWRDLAAIALFAYSIFTLETGLLILLVFAVFWALGQRAISMRALVACTGIFVVYMGIRFLFIKGGLPDLDERSAGFWLRGYSQDELVDEFDGPMRIVFYGHNVLASVLTVLFTEPRAGIWRLVADVVHGEKLSFGMILAITTSIASTALIFFYVRRRWSLWRRREFDYFDRLVVLFFVVLVVNSGMSFPYTKDVIMGPAGVLYPIALYAALREFAAWADDRRADAARPGRIAALAAGLLLLISAGWAIRALTVPYEMRRLAYQYHGEWTDIDQFVEDQGLEVDARRRDLVHRLRDDALSREVPNPYPLPVWPERLIYRR